MKKYFCFILIAFFAISLMGCATYATMNTNKWLEYELLPSKIIKNGKVFFEGKLSDGSIFSVFFDEEIADDEGYYYVMLMQNFGWKSKDDKTWTAPQDSRRYKLGHIYINPNRRVAVYFYPRGTYSAFKVNID